MHFYNKTNTNSNNKDFHLPIPSLVWKTLQIEMEDLQTCLNEKKTMIKSIKHERCIPELLKQLLKSQPLLLKLMKQDMMIKNLHFSSQ